MPHMKFVLRAEELVAASPPHPANTFYRVAIGPEDWNGLTVEVEKIQMVYGGRIAGRKAPSYPAAATMPSWSARLWRGSEGACVATATGSGR